MIGKDFPPNDFLLFGLNLTDPTDFIYDCILGIVSLFFAFRLSKLDWSNPFYKSWTMFFLVFGGATLCSAFGHLFYNYSFYIGKLLGWILIPISIYWIERAMIEAHENNTFASKIKSFYLIKLILVYVVCLLVWLNIDPFEKPQLLFLPIAINTIAGLVVGVGITSYNFKKKLHSDFKYTLFGILAIFPTAFIFILKINLHPWFSKNDFSHILMLIGIAFFYHSVVKLHRANFMASKK